MIQNISTPSAPVEFASHKPVSSLAAYHDDVYGHYLVANTGEGKLVVVDIREPPAPVFVGAGDPAGGWPEISGNYVIGADYGTGIINVVNLVPE